MMAYLGANIPYAELMPGGLIPAPPAFAAEPFAIPGKNGLVVLNDRPLNAETLPHFLDMKSSRPTGCLSETMEFPPKRSIPGPGLSL